MTPEQLNLSRQLVACEQWRWHPGMRWGECGCLTGAWIRRGTVLDTVPQFATPSDCCAPVMPDLTDYATAAILLRIAMESAQTSEARNCRRGGEGRIHLWFNYTDHGVFDDDDLGTAVAKALLAIWGTDDS